MAGTVMRIVNTIVFKDEDIYVASGVELDVVAQGRTREEARDRLDVVINAEVAEAASCNRDLFDIGPAPEIIQEMFRDLNSDVLDRDERLVA